MKIKAPIPIKHAEKFKGIITASNFKPTFKYHFKNKKLDRASIKELYNPQQLISEKKAYVSAKGSKTKLYAFIKKYPNTPLLVNARNDVADIIKLEKEEADRIYWAKYEREEAKRKAKERKIKAKERERKIRSYKQGDTAYVYAKNAGKTTWFDKEPLIYYAKVSIEQINYSNSKVKVYIEKICWKNAYGGINCNESAEGGFRSGSYKWVTLYDLDSNPW